MSYPADIKAFVLAVPGLENTGMHRTRLPRKPTLPAISWKRFYTETGVTHSGASNLGHEYTELACCGESEEDAEEVARLLELALNGYRGSMGQGFCQAAFVRQIRADDQADLGMYYRIVPVDVYYREGDGS